MGVGRDKVLACRTGRFDIGTVLDGIWALFDNKISADRKNITYKLIK